MTVNINIHQGTFILCNTWYTILRSLHNAFLLTLKNQSQMESGCGWNVVLCEILQAAAFCRSDDDEDDAAAAAAATTPAQPFGHCFSGVSSKLAEVLRLDTIRRSNTRSSDDIARVRTWYYYTVDAMLMYYYDWQTRDVDVSLHFCEHFALARTTYDIIILWFTNSTYTVIIRKWEENNGQLNMTTTTTTTTTTKITSITSTRSAYCGGTAKRAFNKRQRRRLTTTHALLTARELLRPSYIWTLVARAETFQPASSSPSLPASRRSRVRASVSVHYALVRTHTRAHASHFTIRSVFAEGARELTAFPGVSIVTVWGLMMRVPPCTSIVRGYITLLLYCYYHTLLL